MKKLIVMVTVCLLVLAASATAIWFDTDFNIKVRFDTNHNTTNESVPFVMNGSSGINLSNWTDSEFLQTDCSDFRIINFSENQNLSFELVNDTCGDHTEIWFAPSLTAANFSGFFYGESDTAPSVSNTSIWGNQNLLIVYHFGFQPFENNSYPGANISSDLGLTGQAIPFATAGSRHFGNARTLNGSTMGFIAQEGVDIIGSNLTIEAWVNVTKAGGATTQIIQFANSTLEQISVGVTSAGRIECKVRSTSGLQAVTAALTIPVNTWSHVVCMHNGTHTTAYLNGVQDGSVANAANLFGGRNIFSVGSTRTGASALNGSIDELKIWNESRTFAQIQQAYDMRLNGRVLVDMSNQARNSSATVICDEGEVQCGGRDGAYIIACEDDNSNTVFDWSNKNRTYCSGGCSEGACVATQVGCVNQCNTTSNQLTCGGAMGKYSVNCTTDSRGCEVWNLGNKTYCQYGCNGGRCLNATHSCFPGSQRCFGNQIMPCRDINGDGFAEWDITNLTACTNECMVRHNSATGLQEAYCEFGSGNLSVIYSLQESIDNVAVDAGVIFPNEAWRGGFIMAVIIVIWGLVSWKSSWEIGTMFSLGLAVAGLFVGWVPFYIGIIFILMSGLILFMGLKNHV